MQILIVDDDFMARGGLASLLATDHPASHILQASTLSEAIDRLSAHRETDLVLLDLQLDDSEGIDTLKTVKAWCEEQDVNPRIVVVSGASDDALVSDTIENCATGFITKGSRIDVFRHAIGLTLAGEIYIPERYLRDKRDGAAALRVSPQPVGAQQVSTTTAGAGLTRREAEVVSLVIRGLTYKQIARKLTQLDPSRTLSDGTVRVHMQNVAWKLQATNPGVFDGLTTKAAIVTAYASGHLKVEAFESIGR